MINLNNDYGSSECTTCNNNLNNLFGEWGKETLVNLRKYVRPAGLVVGITHLGEVEGEAQKITANLGREVN